MHIADEILNTKAPRGGKILHLGYVTAQADAISAR